MSDSHRTLRQTLILKIDKRNVATLTLDRPKVHNAMSLELIHEMRQVISELEANPEVRAVVLTASGKSFCAGGDLRWMQETVSRQRAQRLAEASELAEMLAELDALGKPLIGRINGPAYGGGLGLIACCDFAIAVETAEFALTEVLLGLLPATISPFVIRRIGVPNARRVMLNAHHFSAAEAVKMSLLAETVSAEKLDEAIEKEIKKLLRCAPEAVTAAKRLICAVQEKAPEDVRNYTIEQLADAWETESAKEGIESFFNKRKPLWNPES